MIEIAGRSAIMLLAPPMPPAAPEKIPHLLELPLGSPLPRRLAFGRPGTALRDPSFDWTSTTKEAFMLMPLVAEKTRANG